MIFVSQQVAIKEDAECVVSQSGTKFTIAFTELGEFVFDCSLVDFRPDIAYLGYSHKSGFYLTWASEIAESRSGAPMTLTRNGTLFSGSSIENHCLASFWLGDVCALLVTKPCFVEQSDGEVSECVHYGSDLTTWSHLFDEAKAFEKRARAKQSLIRKINELNSLAMLEAQLDLVTAFVLSAHPDSDLASVLQGVSTLDIHGRDKLLATVRNQKAHLREIQRVYFAERGDSPNGDPSN